MRDARNARRRGGALLVAALVGALGVVGGAPTAAPAGAGAPAPADDLRINQIQTVGSHNSYHLAASAQETALRRQFIGSADDLLQYSHAPLGTQLQEQKVRQIELDVFRDDVGGKYANPLIRGATGGGAYSPVMQQPGVKVLHTQDVDYRSTCLTLVSCLQAVRTWSDAQPDHLPIAILLELKDDEVPFGGGFDFTVPDKWTAPAMGALDAEIRSVFDESDLITPDDIRGGATTLEQGVLSTGWPTLGESRGKVMFLMDNGGGYRDAYRQGAPNLEGRVMFTNSTPGQPDAAFVKENDPLATTRIQGLVAGGYMVRTRSDADTREARSGDTRPRDAAFASGAQWVSTDYPVAEYARPFGTRFVVEVPGGTMARCNPVNGPQGCVSSEIEPFPERAETPYVEALYQTFFGRPPSNVDQWFWSRRIELGGSRASVATALARSREGAGGPILADTYQRFLGRAIDPVGRTYWRDRVAAGLVLDKVAIGLLASPEAYAQGGGTPEDWVDLVYQRSLGRSADSGGRAYFADLLRSGATRSTVARLVLSSAEARTVRVRTVVQTLLERAPSAAEAAWLTAILRGRRDIRDVYVNVVITDEFRNRL